MSNTSKPRQSAAITPPTLMLLPGLLCDEAVWAQQCEALRDVQCVIPAWGALASITAMAQRVLAEAPAECFALAGHSMGGRVALEVMRLAPERVERLALLDTGIDPIAPGPAGAAERDRRMALLALARQRGMRETGRQWARGMVHPARVETPLFGEILDMVGRKSPAIFEAQIQALLTRPDAATVLDGVRCPTLIMCGRQDTWSPLARHEVMHTRLPGSRLVVVEEAGHMTTMEQPEAVTQAMAEWMEA